MTRIPRYRDMVLIAIEDCKQQLYHRLKVNDITVLVDATPVDDPDIGALVDLILAAPDLLAALEELQEEVETLRHFNTKAGCALLDRVSAAVAKTKKGA